MSLVGLSDRADLYNPTTTGALGPGAYDAKLTKDIGHVKRRSRSDRPLAFGSGAPKDLNRLGGN